MPIRPTNMSDAARLAMNTLVVVCSCCLLVITQSTRALPNAVVTAMNASMTKLLMDNGPIMV